MIVNGSPACESRMPARMPDSPQPITTTGDSGLDVGRDLVAPRDRPAVAAVELHVLEEHAGEATFDGLGGEERHHLGEDASSGSATGSQPPSR